MDKAFGDVLGFQNIKIVGEETNPTNQILGCITTCGKSPCYTNDTLTTHSKDFTITSGELRRVDYVTHNVFSQVSNTHFAIHLNNPIFVSQLKISFNINSLKFVTMS